MPATIADADTSLNGEEVFSESRSLIFKSLKVRRLVDKEVCERELISVGVCLPDRV